MGSQGQQGGNKKPLVQTFLRRAPSLPEPVRIGATPPHPALGSPWWGGLCPQATALVAACKSQQGKAAAPPNPTHCPPHHPPPPKHQHSTVQKHQQLPKRAGVGALSWGQQGGGGIGRGWEQEGGTRGRAHSGADKMLREGEGREGHLILGDKGVWFPKLLSLVIRSRKGPAE